MSHLFGDLISQHLHRKHGLSQAKLAAGIDQEPSVITKMCKGQRLVGSQARERVVAIIDWLRIQGALATVAESNALLKAAGMQQLQQEIASEAALIDQFSTAPVYSAVQHRDIAYDLPAPVTELIGREQDVAVVTQTLRRRGIRALTLVGPPGVGKTRLALRVALDLRSEIADGACFVPLASVSDPTLVISVIAQALRLPDADVSPLAALKSHLRDKQLLLVLDNFEQILAAAPDVAEILAASPSVKILVTSRAALRIRGEHTHEVAPLFDEAAIALFVQRAQAIQPGFELTDINRQVVADICRRLGGLPLSIELAAARIRMLSPQTLLTRLHSQLLLLTTGANDLPPHQRALRDTINWSYNLLTPEEQTAFRRLGVFAGGCTLEAAEQVVCEDLTTPVVDLLQLLVDKSLLRSEESADGPRFSLLEMLREYAFERLEQCCEVDFFQQRHAEFFADLAGKLRDGLAVRGAAKWVARYVAEQDNFRAALTWSLKSKHVETGMRIVAALGDSWHLRGSVQEVLQWVTQILAHPDSNQYPAGRANIYVTGIAVLSLVGDTARSDSFADQAMLIYREIANKHGIAKILAAKGSNAWARAELARASLLCHESVRLFRDLADPVGLAGALEGLASAERDQGQFNEAAATCHEIALIAQSMDSALLAWKSMAISAHLAYMLGDYARARTGYESSRELCETAELSGYELISDWGLGFVTLAQGDVAAAIEHLERSDRGHRQRQAFEDLTRVLFHLGFARHLSGDVPGAYLALREGLQMRHSYQRNRLYLVEGLERLGWMAVDERRPSRAAILLSASESLRAQLGAPFPPGERQYHEPRLATAKDALGSETFAAVWAEGGGMNSEQAVAFALDDHTPAPNRI